MAGDNPIVLVRFIDEGFPLMGVGAKGVSPLLQLKVISDHFFDSQRGRNGGLRTLADLPGLCQVSQPGLPHVGKPGGQGTVRGDG
jgi:hypothetical protein